eukprot:GGOE01057671.1.p1 GENE.GGOE01057671.1~~GGOE01057671.1.p1  ORF type:complete len:304 (-),score=25.47 GGOE01057671.1:101-880(-)
MASIEGEGAMGFWGQRWHTNQIPFHQPEVHPALQRHLSKLVAGQPSAKIFVPMCGKSLDLKFLAGLGHQVVGVEFVRRAIEDFFSENSIAYTVERCSELGEDADVFVSGDGRIRLYRCDLYRFHSGVCSTFDAIWDRGSLVAAKPADRKRYIELMHSLMSPTCQYLLESATYDQSQMPGPPNSVPYNVIQELFGDRFEVEQLEITDASAEWQARVPSVTRFSWGVYFIRWRCLAGQQPQSAPLFPEHSPAGCLSSTSHL